MSIISVCVNCGSNPGTQPEYLELAQALGAYLGERGIRLVYGGSSVGLMGAVADAALASGGEVLGVIPTAIYERVGYEGEAEIEIVDSMHARKDRMFHSSDAFIALPGGIGTLEELFELLTWAQLGFHSKPIGLLSVHGYYDKLRDFLAHAAAEGFVKSVHLEMLLHAETPAGLMTEFERYRAPTDHKWTQLDLSVDASGAPG
ncbi:MAG: TIGR00730 family Rossman fold protein [Pseudomonadota bacterium]